jgi:hypothetical protein
MYRLLSHREIMNNLLTLVAPYLKQKSNVDYATIKQAFIAYLHKIQPHCPYMAHSQMFHAGDEVEKAFDHYFAPEIRVPEAGIVYDPGMVQYANPSKRQEALEIGLKHIQDKDPIFAKLFQLIMNTVFCTASKRLGGTSVNPSYIGVMCAYYDMTAEEEAVPELLIHEFAHNALFLDELRYGHYTNYQKLSDPSTYVNAVYRDMPIRLPFDRCLHSLIVSAEVLLARDAYIGHENRVSQHLPTDQLIKRAKGYVAQIKANEMIHELMTERCQKIFGVCAEYFDSL